MPRPARAPAAFVRLVLRERITALNHEAFDDTVKASPVIKAFLGELLEILHVTGRHVGPQFQNHDAFRSFDYGRFAHENLRVYFTESAGTSLMLSMFTRLTGRSDASVGVVAIFSRTSSPLMS